MWIILFMAGVTRQAGLEEVRLRWPGLLGETMSRVQAVAPREAAIFRAVFFGGAILALVCTILLTGRSTSGPAARR
jgi:hypothetical protein